MLEQTALDSFLPMAQSRGVGIVLGGPYNSGILATGPKPGAFYNYDPAPDWVLARARQLQDICHAHGVKLIDAALQFPLFHPAVVSVIPGGQGTAEMVGNLAAASAKLPAALWSDLRAAGLLPPQRPNALVRPP